MFCGEWNDDADDALPAETHADLFHAAVAYDPHLYLNRNRILAVVRPAVCILVEALLYCYGVMMC